MGFHKSDIWRRSKSVTTMTSHKKVVYIALVGHPVLEVAAITARHGYVTDLFHHFITYFNGVSESFHIEPEPVTDSFGTRFEHAIGEDELDKFGFSLCYVQEKLRRFLSTYEADHIVIVNDILRYDEMKPQVNATGVWSKTTTTPLHRNELKLIFQDYACSGHLSSYYQCHSTEPECALVLAGMMMMASES